MDSLVLVGSLWAGSSRHRAQSPESTGATRANFPPFGPNAWVLPASSIPVSALSDVTDPSHQLVWGWPDLIYPQRGACLWADSPLWRWSSRSSSYKLALVSLQGSYFLLILPFFYFLFLSLLTNPPFSHLALRPCDCLLHVPGETANSIRETCLTNALPLSASFLVLAICGAACWTPHFLLCDQYPQSLA